MILLQLGVIEVLVAYTALMVTIVSGILAFLFYQYFPLKHKVNQLYRDWYGNGGTDGARSEIDDEHESMKGRMEAIESKQDRDSERLADLEYYVRKIAEFVDRETESDIPTAPRRIQQQKHGDD